MSTRQIPARLLTLVAAVLAAGVLSAVSLVYRFPPAITSVMVLLAAAEVASELFPVRLPSGAAISVSYPINVAALLLAGPAASLVNALLGMSAMCIRVGKPPVKFVYNFSQVALSTSIAGWAFVATCRAVGLEVPLGPLGAELYPTILAPVLAFSAVAFLLNTLLVGAAVSISQGMSFVHVWRTNAAWQGSTQIALALLGIAMAQAIVQESWLGLVLFAVPLVVSRGIFQGYVRLREAYADTVRGLVTAIEAKDPYTRGHSERVAEYAVGLATTMRLPDFRVEQIELAALLHDLGKVGIGRDVLTKEGRLTEDEMSAIREHPRIAADIIRAVPFLQASLPAIMHHHERFDGTGYVAGISGEDIPMEARILAVADCYDAMTSERPYKRVLDHSEAIDELTAGAGTQFDAHVVRAFVVSQELQSDFERSRGPGE